MPVNHLRTINLIIDELDKNGYADEASILAGEQSSASSGTELLMRIGFALNRLAEDQPQAYKTIEAPARKLMAYCHSIGLFPH